MSSAPTRTSESKNTPAPNKNQQGQDRNDVREDFQTLFEDVGTSIHKYCRQRPQMAGLVIFALGFYVGWKVKPW